MEDAMDQEGALATLRKSRKKLFIVLGLGAAAVGAFVLYWFQPQALFLNKQVEEAAPPAMETESRDASTSMNGRFRSLAHTTTGKELIIHG